MVARLREIPSLTQIFSCLARGRPSTYVWIIIYATVEGEARELVEGPADELILQRAYIDNYGNYGKQPIEDGIDIVAVDSLAFQRYCELASLISKPLTVVTDNDGNAVAVRKRYEKYTGLVTLCVESDNTLNTLEPSVLAANLDTFESFKSIIYLGKDIESRDPDSIKSFMIGNKTDWSMRVFTSEKKINYPSYILKAIGIDSENVGDRDESGPEHPHHR